MCVRRRLLRIERRDRRVLTAPRQRVGLIVAPDSQSIAGHDASVQGHLGVDRREDGGVRDRAVVVSGEKRFIRLKRTVICKMLYIFVYYEHPISTGYREGTNDKILTMSRRAHGSGTGRSTSTRSWHSTRPGMILLGKHQKMLILLKLRFA